MRLTSRGRVALLVIAELAVVASVASAQGGRTQPRPAKPSVEVVPLAKVLADPVSYKKGPLRVRGTMIEPAETSGWYFLSDGERRIRVVFADYTVPPPQGVDGDRVVIEGFVQHRKVTKKDARFQPKDPNPIQPGQRQLVLIAYYVERNN